MTSSEKVKGEGCSACFWGGPYLLSSGISILRHMLLALLQQDSNLVLKILIHVPGMWAGEGNSIEYDWQDLWPTALVLLALIQEQIKPATDARSREKGCQKLWKTFFLLPTHHHHLGQNDPQRDFILRKNRKEVK